MLGFSRHISKLLMIITLTGCSGGVGVMDGIMQSWVGASVDDVIVQWGYPSEEKMIAGRKLYLWHYTKQVMLPGSSQTTGTVNPYTGVYNATTTSTPAQMFSGSCTRILVVDKKNIVKATQWDGNNCPFAEWMEYANWRRKQPDVTQGQ